MPAAAALAGAGGHLLRLRHLEPRVPDSPPPLPAERLEEIMARLGRMSQDVLRACWKALEQWPGTEERAPAIGVPTLILCGERDAPELLAGSRRLPSSSAE